MTPDDDMIAWVPMIAQDVMDWDMDDVGHLRDMLLQIRKMLAETHFELIDFVDRTRIPSMSHPVHGYTQIIWAVDRRGMALVGASADRIVSVDDIVLGRKHREAAEIVTSITRWDTEDVATLRDLFASLHETIAVGGITVSEIIDPDLVPSTGDLPDSVPEYRIWAVDRQDRVLVGEHADEIKSMDEIIAEGVLVEARWMAGCIESWRMMDVGVLRSMLLELQDILDDEAIASSLYKITDFVDMSSLPTAAIPADLPREKLWAIDTAGYALVGDNADQIMSVADWRKLHRPAV